ncbi:MAG: molybdopterin biosynthesis protein, partial [Pseudomonadota bacterium]
PAPITLHPFRGGTAHLVMTKTPGFKDSLLDKGADAVRTRVEALGYTLSVVTVTDHAETAVAEALKPADLVLVLGVSATSDRSDVVPAAVLRAGGQIDRFGMPVDPGNLLFLGKLKGAPVVGLPGCARSPALNGVDWVLERLSARLPIAGDDIAAMGVGGLLKEMAGRPQPRQPKT